MAKGPLDAPTGREGSAGSTCALMSIYENKQKNHFELISLQTITLKTLIGFLLYRKAPKTEKTQTNNEFSHFYDFKCEQLKRFPIKILFVIQLNVSRRYRYSK